MGQEMIESFHRWEVILGVVGMCGTVLLAVLFWKFRYGTFLAERLKNRRERRKRLRDGTALLLAAALLAPPAGTLAAEVSGLPVSVNGTAAGRVSVTVEGDSVRPNVYRDTAVAEITFQEKNFDEESVSVTVGDETGRETRITFEDGRWRGLSGLGEGVLEVIPYGRTETGGEEAAETLLPGENAERWFLDSEEGVLEHTEERTVKMRLRLPKEGCFVIREAVCRDLAGNISGLSEPIPVTIDRTPPVLQMVLPGEELAHEGYYGHPITVWLYLKEHNFKAEEAEGLPQVILETRKKGVEENGEGGEPYAKKTIAAEGMWEAASEKGSDWYKLPVSVTEDGNYRLRVSYADPAGWPLSAESRAEQEFTVDATAPEFGAITVMGETWKAFMEQVTFGLYSSDEEAVILEGGDSVSPVEPLRYFCADRELTEHDLQGIGEEQWKEGDSLVLVPDLKTVIYLKVTNYAGLSSYFNSSGLVIENKGPLISLSPRGEAWAESGIYRGDVELSVALEEPEETGVASGLRRASYVLEAEREGTRALIREGILLDETAGTGGTGSLKSWQDGVLLRAAEYDGEVLWFTVFAEDMAGNRSEKGICLSMDQTAPKLQITYGGERPENDSYYNQERRVRLTIEEANFSEERVWIAVTNTDRVLPEISGWSHSGNLHSCQITFSEDGDYTFSVRCEDLAGHRSEKKEEDFTIDRTPPRVSVEFSEEGRTEDGRYYREPGTLEITVEEHNFNRERVVEEMTALLDDGGNGCWRAESFDSRGDIHTASLPFSEDGEYRFSLTCTDQAGNADGEETKAVFSVDRTPPSIEILGLEPNSANRGEVEAEIRFVDKRLMPGSASVELSRLDGMGRGKEYQYQELLEDGGVVIKTLLPENFPGTEEVDGLYLLRAAGTDRAGNRTERELSFSVNRYGSVYAAAGETEEWLCAGEYPYLSEEREVVIREYNVDPVEDFQVSLGRNGVVSLLTEGKGFRRSVLSEQTSSAGWRVYEYRIPGEVFRLEGDYELLFHSADRAGNRMGNEFARNGERERVFAFSVDKTGPSAVLSGAEDGGRYRADGLEVFLDICDNMRLQKVEVRTEEGKSCYEGEELEQLLSKEGLRVKLPETDDWQTLELYAEDAAGNGLELGNGRETGAPGCLKWEFLITSDWWIQLCKDPVRFALFLFFAGGIFVAAGFLAAYRGRVKKEIDRLRTMVKQKLL